MPAASRAWFSSISSDTIDFDFVTLRTPWCFAMSTISRAASSCVSAYSTFAPCATALRSKVSSQTSRFASARLRRSTRHCVSPRSRRVPIVAARAVTNLGYLLQVLLSGTSASFWPARSLKYIEFTPCITRSRQNLSDVQHASLLVAGPAQPAFDVKHAAQVAEHDGIGPACLTLCTSRRRSRPRCRRT